MVLLVGYAVVCPLLLLYALGYIVAPSGEELRRTGGIFVTSLPQGATLSVDGTPYPKPTPTAVLQLRPGPYRIRVEHIGYEPVEEKISVEPGRVTSLDNLLLAPVHRASVIVAPDWFLDLIPAPGYPYIILKKGTRARDLVVYDIPNRRFIDVIDGKNPLRDEPIVACLTVNGSSDFLFEIGDRGSPRIFRVRIQWPRPLLQELTDVLPTPFEAPRWTVENPEEIFSYNGSSVDQTDAATGKVVRGIVTRVSGYGLDGRRLYAITWQHGLLRFDVRQQTTQDLHAFDTAVTGFPVGRFVSVRPFGANIILLWSRGGRFAAAAADPRLNRDFDAVQGYQADAQTGLVLLWQAHYLAVLDVKTPEGEPELERLRLPYAKDIQQAFFVLGKAGILYRDGDSTFLANRLQDDEWRTSFVVTARMGTSVYYSEREGKLYYIDQTTGRLATTDIVPQEQLIDQIVQQLRQDSGH